ncbi:MAG: tRNA (adenosine(37)-N6)-threonylcarbamoyltransferase complex dimerization subunit type 1 TsaB [Bradymonadales bacterium]|nr:MAG: tRNA (adenosine(37)-N6)-threonylcarbamoyltransferase complex dimerization subunit type 1 TsaB [Bradymonadales bacterium]
MRLVFDSSSPALCVGLFCSEKGWLFVRTRHEQEPQQSKLLFRQIQESLSESSVSIDQVESLGLGLGPGSYTGLRVGLTLAKVWSFSKQIPLYWFSSDKIFSSADTEPNLKLLVASDFCLAEEIDVLQPIYQNDHFK